MKMNEFFGTAGESPKIYSLPTAKFAVRRVKNEPWVLESQICNKCETDRIDMGSKHNTQLLFYYINFLD